MSTRKAASIMNSIVMEVFCAKTAESDDQWKGVGAVLRKTNDERPASAQADAAKPPKMPRAIPDCVCALLRRNPHQ